MNDIEFYEYKDTKIWAWNIEKNKHGASFCCRFSTPNFEANLKIENFHLGNYNHLDAWIKKQFPDHLREADSWRIVNILHLMGCIASEPMHTSFSAQARQLPGFYQDVVHPVKKDIRWLGDVIIELNDDHGWSRDAIADWIETLDEVPVFSGEQVEPIEVQELSIKVI